MDQAKPQKPYLPLDLVPAWISLQGIPSLRDTEIKSCVVCVF